MEGIESDKDEFRDRVVAARENPLVSTRANALEGMADRVRSGGAGIRNHLTGRSKAKCVLRVNDRFLRWIIRDPRCGTPIISMTVKRAIIIFTESHPAAGCADDGQLGPKIRVLGQCFFQRPDRHVSYAVQTLRTPHI